MSFLLLTPMCGLTAMLSNPHIFPSLASPRTHKLIDFLLAFLSVFPLSTPTTISDCFRVRTLFRKRRHFVVSIPLCSILLRSREQTNYKNVGSGISLVK